MLAIELKSLTKSFGAQPVLENISLEIEQETVCVVMGASGAGKTTLLRIVAGLEKPDCGDVLLGGKSNLAVAPNRRGIAYLSQDYALYPQLTIRRNLLAALAPLRLKKSEESDRVRQVIEWFGLTGITEKMPATISGGQAQRAALAKAIVRRPSILLLDEPLSQLDTPLRQQLRQLLPKLVDSFSVTLILVMHDPLDALDLADRLVVLEGGRLRQVGEPQDVYNDPASAEVAELLSPLGVNWLSRKRAADYLPQNRTGRTGFRPEDAQVHSIDAPVDPGCLAINVSVERIRFLGIASIASVRPVDTSWQENFAPRAFTQDPSDWKCMFSDPEFVSGNRCSLRVPTDKLLIFPDS